MVESHDDKGELAGDILLAILSVMTTILILLMVIHFCKNEYKYKQYGLKFWVMKPEILISASILLQYLLFAAHTSIDRIYSIATSVNDSFNASWCGSASMELLVFSIAKLLLYSFFLFRLHKVFKDSSFAVSTTILKTIGCVAFVPLMTNVVYVYLYTH